MEPAASAEHITYRQLHIRGLRIHVQIYGAGEPLLLHSGIWADVGLWKPLLPHLRGFRTIAFDPPGVGRSQQPAFRMTMRTLASFGTAVLDKLGLESAHVLGASFGGAVAQQMAIRDPGRVRRLVLTSTSFSAFSVPGSPAAVRHFIQPGSYRPTRLEQVAGAMFGGRRKSALAMSMRPTLVGRVGWKHK